jgi:hypothetical protein
MEIIVPAAGLSTRFPGTRPKYLLYDYTGTLMLRKSLEPYLDKYNITIGLLKEHDEQHHASEMIFRELGSAVRVVVLDERTAGPADTVYQIIKRASIPPSADIFIKDCDSFFDHNYTPGNYVCVSKIADHEVLKKLSSKSFVVANEQQIIQNIIEKTVVSDTFCVGGYKFESAKLFVDTFEKLSAENIKEIFVSHIIQDCLIKEHIFETKAVTDYVDVGTLTDWVEYNDRPVIFCDIDGTLIRAQSKHGPNSYNSPYTPLVNNVNRILALQNKGCQLIFTTARPDRARSITTNMLNELGFKDFTLIMNLNNSARILINDYNEANPYPRASAINIKRNQDNLGDFI